MLGFIAAETTTTSWISDIFGSFGMPFVTEKIGMVKRVKSVACKKSQGNNAEPQYRPANIMIMEIRDIFYLFASFLENGVINYKAPILLREFMEFCFFKNFMVNAVHKCPPPIVCVLFKPIIGVFSADRPLLPLFPAIRVDGLEL
jgi:hypothetical protein